MSRDVKLFEESDLLNWLLTPDSAVMEIGGFDGSFTDQIHTKFGCTVHVYEPVPEFYNGLVRRFAGNPKIRLWPFALGDSNRKQDYLVKGSMSGMFVAEPNSAEVVPVRDFVDVLDRILPSPSLVSLNAEGSEFEIMEYALTTGIVGTIPFWQIQPHFVVPDFQARWDAIVEGLNKTHDHVFDKPWVWSGWKLKAP